MKKIHARIFLPASIAFGYQIEANALFFRKYPKTSGGRDENKKKTNIASPKRKRIRTSKRASNFSWLKNRAVFAQFNLGRKDETAPERRMGGAHPPS